MRPRSLPLLLVLFLAALGLALLPRLARDSQTPAPTIALPPAASSAPSPSAPPGEATPAPPPSTASSPAASAASPATASAASAATPADTTPPPPVRPRGPLRIPAGAPIPELLPHQTERDALERLASTYDPSVIPQVAPYLGHADATVREAARMALLQLGDAAAVPHLQSALALAKDEDERSALQEAIDFLSLPPSTVVSP